MGEAVTYVSDTAPEFKTSLVFGKGDDREKVKVQFHDKQLRLDSEDDMRIIDELDRLIRTRPQISQVIRKLDVAAAEKLALAHKEAMLEQNAGHTGPATGEHKLVRAANALQEKERMRSQGISDEDASQMVEQVMSEQTVAVEKIENPVIQDVPKIKEEEGATDIADAEAKSVFAKLANGE